MSDYRYECGELRPLDVWWPEDSSSIDEDLVSLGFEHVCQLGIERLDDHGLWAQVYERPDWKKARCTIEGVPVGDRYVVVIGLCCEAKTVFTPDFPDVLKLLGELEPLIRLSLVTSQMQAIYDVCAGVEQALPPLGNWRQSRGTGSRPPATLLQTA